MGLSKKLAPAELSVEHTLTMPSLEREGGKGLGHHKTETAGGQEPGQKRRTSGKQDCV